MKTKAFTLICEFPDYLDGPSMEITLNKIFEIGKRMAVFAAMDDGVASDLESITIEPIKEVE